MSRQTWNEIKASKRFYVKLYRRSINILIVSLLINLILSYVGLHMYFNRPARVAYSTNGASPPTVLSPLSAPNKSKEPLLGSDPNESEIQVKVVPD